MVLCKYCETGIKDLTRRVLTDIREYPSSAELFEKIVKSPGMTYKTNIEFYKVRDRALISLTYLLALRVSEVLRLEKEQFTEKSNYVEVKAIQVSKRKKPMFRRVGFLPLIGDRRRFTFLIMQHLRQVETGKLFKFGRVWAYKIVTATLGVPVHWLRAYGEDFLYTLYKGDVLAVADYIFVDPRTITLYLRRRFEKYPIR